MRTRTTSPTSSRVRTSRARSSKVAQFHQCDGLVKSWACSVKRLARLSREVGYVLHLGIHRRRVVTELPRRLLRQENWESVHKRSRLARMSRWSGCIPAG